MITPKVATFLAISFVACTTFPLQARRMLVLSYQQLLDQSDLVVVAIPTSKTADTVEEGFLPGIVRQDQNGDQSKIETIGVETVFKVAVVFKGDKTVRQFVLHHYRESEPCADLDAASLVSFDPTNLAQRSSYLMFLVREQDGRYAPTGGQTDLGYKSVSRVRFE